MRGTNSLIITNRGPEKQINYLLGLGVGNAIVVLQRIRQGFFLRITEPVARNRQKEGSYIAI